MSSQEAIDILNLLCKGCTDNSFHEAIEIGKWAIESRMPVQPVDIHGHVESDYEVGRCPYCGVQVASEMRYCYICGVRLEWGK